MHDARAIGVGGDGMGNKREISSKGRKEEGVRGESSKEEKEEVVRDKGGSSKRQWGK